MADAFDVVCESLCTEFVLQKSLKSVPFGLSWAFKEDNDEKEVKQEAKVGKFFEPEVLVIQEVDHDGEEAATTPEEASAVAEALWSSQVEHLIATGQVAQSDGSVEDDARKIVLLTFSRNPQELENAILNSPVAQQKRQEGVELKPAWANGAKVLLQGVRPERLDSTTGSLRPWHVIVAEEDEDSLLASLQHLRYVIRKLRPDGRAVVPPTADSLSIFNVSSVAGSSSSSSWVSEDAAQDDTSQAIEYTVSRTFIHFQESFETRTVRTV